MTTQPVETKTIDRMTVRIFESNEALGQRAADDFGNLLSSILSKQDSAAVILACANSQLTFLNALRTKKNIAWDKIAVFHMDEYLGMSDQHPASFARFIREGLVDYVKPAAFYPLRGDTTDVNSELERYTELMRRYPPDVCVLGVGENGHLAFNDPPADFSTNKLIHTVDLDPACRKQQVGEGHFQTLQDVPTQALSLTVPALLAAKHALAIVPEKRKAAAIRAALNGPVTPNCPASILRTQPQVTMYLDRDSASMLGGPSKEA
jgi:glucosamine-6-phosphate deaminase